MLYQTELNPHPQNLSQKSQEVKPETSPAGSVFSPQDIARFNSKVDRSGGPDACWPWTDALWGGYGNFYTVSKNYRASRAAYIIANGNKPIPHEICACHSCDNRKCCNPAHLFPGTKLENNVDRAAKGRPTNHKGVVLGPQKILEVKDWILSGASPKDISAEFGLSLGAVYNIRSGRRWGHVTGFEVAA